VIWASVHRIFLQQFKTRCRVLGDRQ